MKKLCACGCRRTTAVIIKTDKKQKRVKGAHNKFINGHNAKGKNNPNFGKIPTEESKRKNREAHWTGDKVGYKGAHIRVKKERGTPRFCEICKTTDKSKRYEWANLTGNYADVKDYKRMCCPCHQEYDKKRIL